MNKIDVYLESGKKRVFAAALDWPGWCRSGKDESSALQALLDYGSRYGHAVSTARLGFQPQLDVSAFVIKERLKGNATTDFGAPGAIPSQDTKPVDAEELRRLEKVLKACWRALDSAIESASGKTLHTGPRGGGRKLENMLEHLLGSDAGYLSQTGWKFKQDSAGDPGSQFEPTRQAILKALAASARGEIPEKGPRGGVRWKARYFVRRIAWHTLDHAWEIEDRLLSD